MGDMGVKGRMISKVRETERDRERERQRTGVVCQELMWGRLGSSLL